MKLERNGGLGGLITTGAAVFLGIAGLSLVGMALASQRSASNVAPRGEPVHAHRSEGAETDARSSGPRGAKVTESRGPVLRRSKPVVLDIPSIDVHSRLQHLGQTADGALETPAPGPHYDEAAWYRHSPTPGSLGPAVLLGHVDSATHGPSVFFRLGELERGDLISIGRADGSVASFVVDEVHRYAKAEFPTKLVYEDIDHAGLRILTCGGAFDHSTGHYLDNVVVFAHATSG